MRTPELMKNLEPSL